MAVIFRYKLYHHPTKNVYKISSLNSYRRYTQENKQSSLLDFNPLLRDGDWRLMWKASLYNSRFQLSSKSNTVVLFWTTLTRWIYSVYRLSYMSWQLLGIFFKNVLINLVSTVAIHSRCKTYRTGGIVNFDKFANIIKLSKKNAKSCQEFTKNFVE